MRLRTMQAGPVMQMPIFILLFLAPVYVPLDARRRLGAHVARFNPVTALLEAARGFIAGEPTKVAITAACLAAMFALAALWARGGLRPPKPPARPERLAARMRGLMAGPRNLVNLKDVAKGYGSRSVLRDVTLGVAAGDRIGVVGAQRRRQVDAAAPDLGRRDAGRGRGHARGRPAPRAARPARRARRRAHDPRGARRRARRPRVAGRRDVSLGPRRAARRRRAGPLPAGHRHADRPAVGRRAAPDRARQAAARRPRAAAARRADEPPRRRGRRVAGRATSPRAAARCSSSTHDRWFLDAVCTRDVGGRRRRDPPVRGRLRGVRARARRARPPGGRAQRPPPAARCARSSPGCAAARPRARPSRSSASRPRTR